MRHGWARIQCRVSTRERHARSEFFHKFSPASATVAVRPSDPEEGEVVPAAMKVRRNAQVEPSRREREEHELTHIPYRSWCRHCVRGRGKNEAHRRLDAEASHEASHVSMDYCFMGQDEEKCLPILAMKDHRSKTILSHVLPK